MMGREPTVHAGLSTSSVGAVHYIVMNECACLQQFERRSGLHDGLIVFATSPAPSPECESRAQSLTASQDGFQCVHDAIEVFADGLEHWPLMVNELREYFLDTRAQIVHIEW